MSDKKYIIKNLAPWMMDELIAFSNYTTFDIIFLREQDKFYKDKIQELNIKNINIYTRPISFNNFIYKLSIAIKFLFSNFLKFGFDYSGVIGIKSIWWFLFLDMSIFSNSSNIHAQFATQPAIVSLLIKKYYKDKPKYSFTFHAYDIYFNNKWFSLLVNNCHKAFSISNYNIEYINKKFLNSEKIVLSRLGVFHETIEDNISSKEGKVKIFTLGLISWFVEKKGIGYLLDSMLALKENKRDNIKLILAGDGPLKGKYLEFIKNNNLTDSIEYIGKVKGKQKEDFFNAIDVFVLPSISLSNDQDGIPVVLMEAISFSLPLISTDVSGIPEICINDYNGLLIKEKNISELIEAIKFMDKNKIEMSRYAKNSFSLSKKYDIIVNSKIKLDNLLWIN